jgi:hypothetical protein
MSIYSSFKKLGTRPRVSNEMTLDLADTFTQKWRPRPGDQVRCNRSLRIEICRVLANGVADAFGRYETVLMRVDGLSTAGKSVSRSARASEGEAGAVDEGVETRMKREALREARYARCARYERTRRFGKRLIARSMRYKNA